jgi:predicted ATPase/DNA-binding SARP family transcriptional activator
MQEAPGGPAFRVDVLGPLRLTVDGAAVDVRGPKRRGVLALLAVAEGRAVTVDHLLDALWASEPPESGRAALHSHISRLRGHLGQAAGRLETLDGGYRLVLADGELDATRARRLLEEARSHSAHDPARACVLLREGRALWRGPALADLADVAPLTGTAIVLDHLHNDVTDLLIDCAIDAGLTDDAVSLATTALAADPLREPAVLRLMRALAVTGRAPEAMRTSRDYRRRLVDEAGLDPSPALAALERDIAGGAVTMPDTANTVRRGRVRAAAEPVTRPVAPLMGREAHVAALHRLVGAERLITVVGPGGVGKTRVALEVARRTGTVAVLLLAPVTDPGAIPHALAAALELQVTRGDVLSACITLLAGGPGVLVVDNCEHLLDAVRDTVGALLDGCPELTVLATSRERLGLAGECTSRLAPLPLPRAEGHGDRAATRLADAPSVAVFLDRAARVRPGFVPDPDDLRLIAGIVRRLDGMPLAIELAAGRLSTFSLRDLSDRLDRALDLLGGGRPTADARHRTLRATVEWSYDLLAPHEQRLFRHLSVFVDGFDVPAAEFVGVDLGLPVDPAGALAHLVDASMIDVVFDGPARYRMLETLRAFGVDRLAATGEGDEAEARLLRWAVDRATWICDSASSEREPDADAALRRELPNLRAAWRLARERRRLDDAATLVITLAGTSNWRDLVEIRAWADELATDGALDGHPRAAAVLGSAANVTYMQGDHARARRLALAGLEQASDSEGSWHCLTALSLSALGRGDHADVVDHALAAAAHAPDPSENLGVAALGALYARDLDRARALHARMSEVAVSPTLRAFAAYVAGEIHSAAGHPERSEDQYARAIDLARLSGATFVTGIASVGLQTLRASAGRTDDALRGYRDLIDYWSRTGNWNHQWTTLRNLANLLRQLGDHEPATLLDDAADHAPDASTVDRTQAVAPHSGPSSTASRTTPREVPNRARVLEIALQAIARNLTGN